MRVAKLRIEGFRGIRNGEFVIIDDAARETRRAPAGAVGAVRATTPGDPRPDHRRGASYGPGKSSCYR